MHQTYRIFNLDYDNELKESKKFFIYPDLFKPIFEDSDSESYLIYIKDYSVWMKYLCAYFLFYYPEKDNYEFK